MKRGEGKGRKGTGAVQATTHSVVFKVLRKSSSSTEQGTGEGRGRKGARGGAGHYPFRRFQGVEEKLFIDHA